MADEKNDAVGDHAYVSLLHGTHIEFFLYAAVLGNQLSKLDEETKRILLVGTGTHDYEALGEEYLEALREIWDVNPIELVDAPMADKSYSKRHRYVFSKLRALELRYKKILFLDLDIIFRVSPRELFQLPAPAGMYHGGWDRSSARHGDILPPEAFEDGCVNAGLLRLDPPASEDERQQLLQEWMEKVSELTEDDESYLPEQYFLVKEWSEWRHIDVAWNCEVCPEYYIRYGKKKHTVFRAEIQEDWWKLGDTKDSLSKSVCMFHFSGEWLQPWWYLHLTPDAAVQTIQRQYTKRDPRGMVALAVGDWISAVSDLQMRDFRQENKDLFNQVIDTLGGIAAWWWNNLLRCDFCQCEIEEALQCEECDVAASEDVASGV